MTVKEIVNQEEKAAITLEVLKDLPEWFGIESALMDYVEKSKSCPFYATYQDDQASGFIYLTENSKHTMEIYCMGIKKAYHRNGLGKLLVETSVKRAQQNNFSLLEVKTVGPSSDDISYGMTRKFYEKMGFLAVDELKELWDPHNPCLIMVKILKR